MTLDRRRALSLLGAGAVVPAAGQAAACVSPVRFLHGVASGDPLRDRVILWTRLSYEVQPNHPVTVEWQVSETDDFARPLRRGRVSTDALRDFTVKVDATGLRPGREYRYRFLVAGEASPVGRTRTLPGDDARDVVLAVASCSLHPNGFFNAYRAIADLPRVDAVVHLGDYIYEYGAQPTDYGMQNGLKLNRIPEPPRETVTLADYRARHAQYKADPDLQAAHARAPFIAVWDDHEVTNDTWRDGAQNHQPQTEGDYAARKAAALKAYYEWMPVREPTAGQGLAQATMRSFRFGRIVDLHMLESRLTARDESLDFEDHFTGDVEAFRALLNDPSRRLLGEGQLEWLSQALSDGRAKDVAWPVLGNQVVMARVKGPNVVAALGQERIDALLPTLPGYLQGRLRRMATLFQYDLPLNLDAWDGYPAERERLYATLAEAGVTPVVVSGDSHSFWVNDLADAAGARRALEVGATGITSPSPSYNVVYSGTTDMIREQNAEVVHLDNQSKGFALMTFDRERVTADLIAVSTIESREFEARSTGRWQARKGQDGAVGGWERV